MTDAMSTSCHLWWKKLKAMLGKGIIFVEDLHLQRVALISWQKVLWGIWSNFFRKTSFFFLSSLGLTECFFRASKRRRLSWRKFFKVAEDRGVSDWSLEVNAELLWRHKCVYRRMFYIKELAPDSRRPIGCNNNSLLEYFLYCSLIFLPKGRAKKHLRGVCLSNSGTLRVLLLFIQ